jgi:hypothetical protein
LNFDFQHCCVIQSWSFDQEDKRFCCWMSSFRRCLLTYINTIRYTIHITMTAMVSSAAFVNGLAALHKARSVCATNAVSNLSAASRSLNFSKIQSKISEPLRRILIIWAPSACIKITKARWAKIITHYPILFTRQWRFKNNCHAFVGHSGI